MSATARNDVTEKQLPPGKVRELARAQSRGADVSVTETKLEAVAARLEALEASNDELTNSVRALRETVRNLNHSRRHYRLFTR